MKRRFRLAWLCVSASFALLSLAMDLAFAQGVAVYHSPDDSGVNGGPIPIPPSGSTLLHLYMNAGSNPSPGPDPCCAGQGDEILGWNFTLRATHGLVIGLVTPAPGVLVNQSPALLHMNGGDSQGGDLGPTKLADVLVQTTGSGTLSLVRGQATGATLALEYLAPAAIVGVPEPSLPLLLTFGTLALASRFSIGVLARARRARHPRGAVARPHDRRAATRRLRRLALSGLISLLLTSSARAQTACGDLDGDGDVDALDAQILRADLAETASMSLAQSLACNVVSEARAPNLHADPGDLSGQCSMSDVVVMQRTGNGQPPGVADVCATGSSADCCSTHPGVGCGASDTVECVCAQDPSCCTTGWSASCASLACSTPCAPGCSTNAISAENCKSSADAVVDRTVWDITDYHAAAVCYVPAPAPQCTGIPLPIPTIEGFSTRFSVVPGETVSFKVDNRSDGTPPLPYSADIFRIGWYGGAGARRVAQLALPAQQTPQPSCATKCIYSTPSCPVTEQFRDCSNWSVSAQWAVPPDAVSGVYLAKFSKPGGDESHVLFVVREAPGAPPADLFYQLRDQNWQAYNYAGPVGNPAGVPDYGDWLYNDIGTHAVSYNRPFRNRHRPVAGDFFFEQDLPLIFFLERNGFSVGYAGSSDLDEHPDLLANRKVYLAGGHDEYWSGGRRNAVEAAASAGTHLLFLGNQHSYIKTRLQDVTDIDPWRVVVGYKFSTEALDPRKNEDDWTGVWRDTRTDQDWTRPASQPARPENALTGTATGSAAPDGGDLTVPSSMAGQRIWRNTCAAIPGCFLGDRNVGYEYEVRADRYYEAHTSAQPPGLFSVTATSLGRPLGLLRSPELDYGVTQFDNKADYTLPRLTSEATLHRRASGALVFSAATMRWSWGLDSARNDGNTGTSSRAVQQAMINLLADMGVQPAFVRKDPTNVQDPELVRATASTDTTPPTTHITWIDPASGLITGTASDDAGSVDGVVAGVEVSFDGGTTWHGANLAESGVTTAWSYVSVVPASVAGLVRAVDDSGNLELAHGSDSPIPPSSGQTIFSTAGDPGWQFAVANTFTAGTGWTLLVPLRLNADPWTDLLSYNAVTGQADYSIAVTAPSCPTGVLCAQQGVSTIAASPAWTSVVPLDLNGDVFTDLLSYNAATGLSYYSLAAPGANCPSGVFCNLQILPRVPPGIPEEGGPAGPVPEASVGWTAIVPMNLDATGGTDLVFYNAATGLAEYSIADSTDCAGSGVYCKQKVVSVAAAKLGWTSVVPLDLNGDGRTDLLSYDAATGQLDYSIAASTHCANGVYCGQAIVAELVAAPGFTSIVPLNLDDEGGTDLLWYNAATGQAIYTVASTTGCAPGISCAQDVVSVQNPGPGWNVIVPTRFNADLRTDLIWYR